MTRKKRQPQSFADHFWHEQLTEKQRQAWRDSKPRELSGIEQFCETFYATLKQNVEMTPPPGWRQLDWRLL